MHVMLLRLALALYSVGFAHAVLTALNKKQTLFRPALAALFIAFAAAVMYLIQERALKSKHSIRFYTWLPSLDICDDLAYRSLAIGFPLITLGIITGALWAQAVWGVWARDAKVLFSFLTWLVYMLLIFYRLIAGWRGRKAAYLSIVGFIGVLVTFLGANYFGGLHTFNQ